MTHARLVPSRSAQLLGFGGLIPFVGLASAVMFSQGGQRAWLASALMAYSAAILTFVGALHWGLTMRDASGPRTDVLVWGVVPSLAAWLAMLLPVTPGLLLVAVLLWVCFAVDRRVYPVIGLQAWLPLRLQLTSVASICCVASAVQVGAGWR